MCLVLQVSTRQRRRQSFLGCSMMVRAMPCSPSVAARACSAALRLHRAVAALVSLLRTSIPIAARYARQGPVPAPLREGDQSPSRLPVLIGKELSLGSGRPHRSLPRVYLRTCRGFSGVALRRSLICRPLNLMSLYVGCAELCWSKAYPVVRSTPLPMLDPRSGGVCAWVRAAVGGACGSV